MSLIPRAPPSSAVVGRCCAWVPFGARGCAFLGCPAHPRRCSWRWRMRANPKMRFRSLVRSVGACRGVRCSSLGASWAPWRPLLAVSRGGEGNPSPVGRKRPPGAKRRAWARLCRSSRAGAQGNNNGVPWRAVVVFHSEVYPAPMVCLWSAAGTRLSVIPWRSVGLLPTPRHSTLSNLRIAS